MLDSPYVRRLAIAMIIAKTPFYTPANLALPARRSILEAQSASQKAPTLITDDGAVETGRYLKSRCFLRPGRSALLAFRAANGGGWGERLRDSPIDGMRPGAGGLQ